MGGRRVERVKVEIVVEVCKETGQGNVRAQQQMGCPCFPDLRTELWFD